MGGGPDFALLVYKVAQQSGLADSVEDRPRRQR